MTDLFNEVLKDQTDEQNLKKFKFLLPLVIIGTIIVAIIMYVVSNYNAKHQDLNAENGNILYQLVNEDNIANVADEHLTTTNELLELKKLSKNFKNTNFEAVLEQLEDVSNNPNYKDITQSYARLLILALLNERIDFKENYNKIFEDNVKFFQNENDLFFGYANILYANYLIQNQEIDKAVLILNNLILSSRVSFVMKEQAKAIQFNINN